MLIVIRADASLDIGSGHVMRCLTLANALRGSGAEVRFICRRFPGHMGGAIEARGYGLALLAAGSGPNPGDQGARAHSAWLGAPWRQDAEMTAEALRGARPDWLIADHYAIDKRWHGLMRPHAEHIMAIDDLADRPLDCDLVLDQSLGREDEDYRPLVPAGCRLCIGPKFALLRPEFAQGRARALEKSRGHSMIGRILVTMGSMDPGNMTGKVLDVLSARRWRGVRPEVDVVLGSSAPHIRDVRAQASRLSLGVNLHIDAENMAQLMAEADLSIGAAGTTSWERCALGLPALIAVLADNQRLVARELEKAGAAAVWGNSEELERALGRLEESDENLRRMRAAAAAVCDGLGCGHVAKELLNYAVR